MSGLDLKVPPPIVSAAVAVVAYLASKWLPGQSVHIPAALFVAVTLGAAGMAVNIAGLWSFRRHRTTVNPLRPANASALVTDGIFAWTRNPMYLGMVLMMSGWTIWLANIVAFLGPPLLAIYLTRFQILPEERILKENFGDALTEYEGRVRRWI